jgi:hypothetical protein
MNTNPWLWIFLGCVVAIVIPRLFSYLIRLHNPYPEDIAMFSHPLDWEHVKATFDVQDAREEVFGRPKIVSQRMVHNRLAASYEYFKRMEHNAWLTELCARIDSRSASSKSIAEAHDQALSEARAMLVAAESCEADATLPAYENEAPELRSRATALRNDAQEKLTHAEAIRTEIEARQARIGEAVLQAKLFGKRVWFRLALLRFLIVLVRIDKLRLVPAEWVIQLWSRGNNEVLELYQEARRKAAEYAAIYQSSDQLLARM